MPSKKSKKKAPGRKSVKGGSKGNIGNRLKSGSNLQPSGKLDIKKNPLQDLEVRQLLDIIDNTPIYIFLVDAQGQISYVNKQIENLSAGLFSSSKSSGPGDFLGCVNAINDANACGYGPNCRICPLRLAILDTLKTGKPHTKFEFQCNYKSISPDDILIRASTNLIKIEPEPMVMVSLDDITKCKLSEQLLGKVDKNLKEAQELASLGSWEWDLDTDEIFWSDEVYRIFGIEPGEFAPSAEAFEAIIHPEDLEDFFARRETILKTKKSACIDHRIILPGGKIRYVQERTRLITDSNDNVFRVIGTVQDITDRVLTENALQQSEERFRNMTEQIRDVLFQTDEFGEITFLSPSVSEVFGFEPGEMIGRKFTNFLFKEDISRAMELFNSTIADGVSTTKICLNMKRKDGSYFAGELNGQRIRMEGNRFGTIGIIRNITDRKSAEEALKQSEERLSRIINQGPIGIVTLNSEFRFLTANVAFCNMTGYSIEELQSMTPDDIAYEGDPEKEIESVEKLLRGEIPANKSEKRYIRKDGGIIWTSVTCVAIRDSQNNFLHFLAMVDDITERKRAEEILRESEIRYRALFEQAGDYVLLLELRNEKPPIIIDVNESALKAHGFTRDELVGKDITILDPDLTPEVARERVRQLTEEDRSLFTAKHRRKNGTYFYAEVQAHKVSLENKTVILTIERDISNRLLMQGILDARIRLLELANNKTLDDILTAALDEVEKLTDSKIGFYHFVHADQKTLTLQNWSTNTLKVMCGADAKGSEYSIGNAGVWVDCIRERRPIIHNDYKDLPNRKSLPDEHVEVVREVIVPIFRGNTIKAILGVGNKSTEYTRNDIEIISQLGDLSWDIVEKMMAVEALKESEEKFRRIAENINDVICQIDLDGTILYASSAAIRNFGYDSASLVGQDIHNFTSETEYPKLVNVLKRARKGESLSDEQIQFRRSDGTFADIEFSAVPVYRDGKIIAVQGIIRDISETKRLRELESRAQRLETAGQVAGQVAHDFNNLLGPLIAYPDMIRGELPNGHPALSFIDDMETAATKIAEINQQLLTLGRRGHYSQSPLNINSIINQSIRDFRNLPKTVIISTDLAPDLFNILGGSAQLHRAVMNLITNAIDAVGSAGTIEIKSENCYVDDTVVSYGKIPRGEYVCITITDSGVGIPDDIAGRIFDPFFTTKTTERTRGSGLGLSVVDAVVRDHGGFTDMKTQFGKGTSFYLYFPIVRQSVETVAEIDGIEGNDSILIVDDDNMQREVSEKLLSRLGYKVFTAESGEKAIEMVKQQSFDLILLDMVMPGGIDGAETYRRILEVVPCQKAMIVSGFAETERVRFAQSLGAGTFVKKPLTMKSIGSAIRREMQRVKSPA